MLNILCVAITCQIHTNASKQNCNGCRSVTQDGLLTSPRSRSPAGRAQAGAPCSDRPAAGPAGPWPGPARTGLPTRERKKEREAENCRNLPGKTGNTRQSVGQVISAGLKTKGPASPSERLQQSSLASMETGETRQRSQIKQGNRVPILYCYFSLNKTYCTSNAEVNATMADCWSALPY